MATSKTAHERNYYFCERVTHLTRFCFRCDITAMTRNPFTHQCTWPQVLQLLPLVPSTICIIVVVYSSSLLSTWTEITELWCECVPLYSGLFHPLKVSNAKPTHAKASKSSLELNFFLIHFHHIFYKRSSEPVCSIVTSPPDRFGSFLQAGFCSASQAWAVTRKTLLRTPFQMFTPSQLLKFRF